MNGYELSRAWFDFAFENPSKITPNHGILYLFCVEHCNRMGWKKEFGLPTTMAKEAIGIKSYNTYINTLNDLVEWGFVIMIQKSKNQFSTNIVALSKFDKALDKALDKASIKHITKHVESTIQSNSSIDKQDNIEPLTNEPEVSGSASEPAISKKEKLDLRKKEFYSLLKPFSKTYPPTLLRQFFDYWSEPNPSETKMRFELEKTWNLQLRLTRWANNDKSVNSSSPTEIENPYK